MTDETIEPITASADGTRNAQSLTCPKLGQSMNYAACLWRQSVLSKPDIRTPADWAPCAGAARSNECTALQMRREEELAGRAIYFRDRQRAITEARQQWIMPAIGRRADPGPAAAAPAAPARPAHALDALAGAGGYADALSIAAKQQASAPAPSTPVAAPATPTPAPAAAPALQVLPGESPLDALRRMRAQRSLSQPTNA